MNLPELIELFRARAHDEAIPYLWQDTEVFHYAVSAQDELVRRMGGIADASVGTPAAGRINDLALATGNPYTAVSQYILKFRRARLITAAREISFANLSDLNVTWFEDYGITSVDDLDDDRTGDVDYVRWFDVPNVADTCRIWFYRLPYPRLDDDNDTLEVGEEHHIHLVDYMLHLAYLKPDEEIYDARKSAIHKASFEEYAEQARREAWRKRWKPRQVQYGGIAW
jgi:hypothetical protein